MKCLFSRNLKYEVIENIKMGLNGQLTTKGNEKSRRTAQMAV